jgi:hypothetical protein
MKIIMFIVQLLIPLSIYADTVIFNKTFGGTQNDFAHSIQQTADGGYIVCGQTDSYGNGSNLYPDIWIIKLDKTGSKEWDKTFGGNKSDFANSVRQTSDGGYVVAGQTESAGAGRYDMWIFKLDNNGNQEPTGIYTQRYIDPYRLSLSQNYPNPFSQSTTIAFILPEPGFVTLTVFDIFGKEKETIFRGYLPPGESKAEWTPGNLSVGVYYYRLQLGQFVKTKSLVLLR